MHSRSRAGGAPGLVPGERSPGTSPGAPLSAVALVVALCLALVGAGCPAHVVLPPPPDPSSSSEELRAQYFEANRSMPVTREQRTPRARMFESTPTFLQRSISLKNGAEVHHVEDLRHLVADDSPAAQAIDLAIEKGGDARVINTSAGVTSGLGLLTGLGTLALGIMGVDTESILPSLRFGDDEKEQIPGYALYGGGTALLTLAIGTGLAVWGTSANDDAADARAQAFGLFDEGLRAKLGLPPLARDNRASSTIEPTGPSLAPAIGPDEKPALDIEKPSLDIENPELDVTPPE
jgi:hypothetical protein